MPELPEVETIVRELTSAHLAGQTITTITIRHPQCLATPENFTQLISGQTIKEIQRRGKFIVITLSAAQLTVHLRMSGHLYLCPPAQPLAKHDHLILTLAGSRELRYHDPRRFGRIWLTTEPLPQLAKLGPEPLTCTNTLFAAALKNQKRPIKQVLLDQEAIAGLGNIYTDEALWLAKIHPRRPANSLTLSEAHQLLGAIRQVLKKGIRNKGTSLGKGEGNYRRTDGSSGQNANSLQVYGRKNAPCPRCHQPISQIKLGGRSTHFCEKCQRV